MPKKTTQDKTPAEVIVDLSKGKLNTTVSKKVEKTINPILKITEKTKSSITSGFFIIKVKKRYPEKNKARKATKISFNGKGK